MKEFQLVVFLVLIFFSCSTKSTSKEINGFKRASTTKSQTTAVAETGESPALSNVSDSSRTNGSLDKSLVRHRNGNVAIRKKCSFEYAWYEVALSDKAVEARINQSIKAIVDEALERGLLADKEDAELYCKEGLEFELRSNVAYAQHSILSMDLYSLKTYHTGMISQRNYASLNFNLTTGEKINFRDLIDNSKISQVDSIIIAKLQNEEDITIYENSEEIDFNNLNFTFSPDGIEFTFIIGLNSGMFKQSWTFEELKPFVKKKSILTQLYKE